MASGTADRVELQVFFCKEAYVYQVPPATTVGHRADTWNVNKWLTEVAVRVATADEDCFVRLEDCETGELFAECPVPPNVPLVTVVEPVIDSSRYFVLRIVDRDTERHAFIGLGFRQRSESSDFNTALYDHQQYIRRKRVAEERRREFEARQTSEGEGEEGEAAPAVDYSIKPGEKITIKINVPKQEKAEGFVATSSKLGPRLNLFSCPARAAGGLLLSPPPAPKHAQQGASYDMCVSPRADSSRGCWGGGEGGPASGSGHEPGGGGVRSSRGDDGVEQSGGQVAEAGAAAEEGSRGVEGGTAWEGVQGEVEEAGRKLTQLGLEREGNGRVDAGGEGVGEDDWGDFKGS